MASKSSTATHRALGCVRSDRSPPARLHRHVHDVADPRARRDCHRHQRSCQLRRSRVVALSRRATLGELLTGGAILGAIALVGLVVANGQFQPRPWRHPPGASLADHWEPVNRADLYVIDGDTFHIGRERFRIMQIDAPEMPAHAHCQREIQLAYQARDYLRQRLVSASVIEVTREDLDRYDRTLGHVRADGEDLGEALMGAGLAQRWEGRHAGWC